MKTRTTAWTALLAVSTSGLLLACSAPGADAGASSPQADSVAGNAAPGGDVNPPPPAPPSPIPDTLNLPGSSDPSPAPGPTVPPGAVRTLWATAGSKLLSFKSDAASKVDAHTVTGLAAGEQLVGLDFRKNGTLYAIGTTSRLFSIAPATAKASAVSFAPFAAPLDGTAFGFGFDPVTDLARVTSNTTQNLRVEATNGTVTNVDGDVHFGGLDVNVEAIPRVGAVAYASDGVGYAIDASTASLTRISDSYSGEIGTIGKLGVNVADVAGFDIAGNQAFAALRVGAVTSLYVVDLETGKVGSLGKIGDGSPVTGLAIQP